MEEDGTMPPATPLMGGSVDVPQALGALPWPAKGCHTPFSYLAGQGHCLDGALCWRIQQLHCVHIEMHGFRLDSAAGSLQPLQGCFPEPDAAGVNGATLSQDSESCLEVRFEEWLDQKYFDC